MSTAITLEYDFADLEKILALANVHLKINEFIQKRLDFCFLLILPMIIIESSSLSSIHFCDFFYFIAVRLFSLLIMKYKGQ